MSAPRLRIFGSTVAHIKRSGRGEAHTAEQIHFDSDGSSLTAETVQEAIVQAAQSGGGGGGIELPLPSTDVDMGGPHTFGKASWASLILTGPSGIQSYDLREEPVSFTIRTPLGSVDIVLDGDYTVPPEVLESPDHGPLDYLLDEISRQLGYTNNLGYGISGTVVGGNGRLQLQYMSFYDRGRSRDEPYIHMYSTLGEVAIENVSPEPNLLGITAQTVDIELYSGPTPLSTFAQVTSTQTAGLAERVQELRGANPGP